MSSLYLGIKISCLFTFFENKKGLFLFYTKLYFQLFVYISKSWQLLNDIFENQISCLFSICIQYMCVSLTWANSKTFVICLNMDGNLNVSCTWKSRLKILCLDNTTYNTFSGVFWCFSWFFQFLLFISKMIMKKTLSKWWKIIFIRRNYILYY